MPLTITHTLTKPFGKFILLYSWDTIVTTNGNKYILTFQDNLTKFNKAISLANQKVATMAKKFIIKIVFEHEMPKKMLTALKALISQQNV